MEIVADVCAALDFSHRNMIVHRDVKPGNVMITRSGAVKVMDFGIARAVADNSITVTQTAAVIGTAQYLSPEQARGETVDARSDVYSTGVLLFELLTGTPPFTGDSPVAVAYQHVRENPVPPSTLNPDVTPVLDAIVLKAMAKNPANRYQSAADMRADLIRAINGRPVSAEPIMLDDDPTTLLGPNGEGSGYGATRYSAAGRTAATNQPDNGRKVAGWIAFAVVVVLIFVLAAILTSRLMSNSKKQVTVPNLINTTRAQAEEELKGKGLTLGQVTTGESSAEQKDHVISQDPLPNAPVAENSAVNLVIGAGPANATVPQGLVGGTADQAIQLLTAAKLGYQRKAQDNSAPAGQVLATNPKSGSQVPPGTVVTLTVSTGKLTVPDVTGQSLNDAMAALNLKGFTNLTSRQEIPTDDFDPNTVLRTDPVAGTKVSPDRTVVIVVAAPKPTQAPTTAQATTAAPTTPAATLPGTTTGFPTPTASQP